ncbi:MAG TPA: pilus (MSHA type) biogenesis protein MshL [Gammaproteobacteria bacterium]|nr:pilus (MSHA type) biogenesis protein MshL [Gammaproteobacteria bacterium]
MKPLIKALRSPLRWLVLASLALATGCQQNTVRPVHTGPAIQSALAEARAASRTQKQASTTPVNPPQAVRDALLEPLSAQRLPVPPALARFDVSVRQAPAREFFMSLVDGTGENLVVHPEVSGKITLNLRNVRIEDVLATVRDIYGYEFRHSHGVYQILPARMRSRVFRVDYLDLKRKGTSRTRISSGQVSQAPFNPLNRGTGTLTGALAGGGTTGGFAPGLSDPTGTGRAQTSYSGAQVSTLTDSDFWDTLQTSLKTLIGEEDGRKIITDPLSGTVLVHAMPDELMAVEDYLNTLQGTVNRQVIIEAKIVEVRLNDRYQAGVNWSAFIDIQGTARELTAGVFGTGLAAPGAAITNADSNRIGGVTQIGAHIGDFDALLDMLETQGDVQVLSSPRVSTVNNQKAIIKVGTDEYFVTDVDINTDVADSVSNQSADVTLTPFFSGVALDVTPQIDDEGFITLHVHPAISEVTQDPKDIDISSATSFSLPLAKSTIRESDTIVRARNGQVVVIGGLMQDVSTDETSATPFFGSLPVIGHAFKQVRRVSRKTELVILLRPLVVDEGQAWSGVVENASARFLHLNRRVVR